MQFSSIGGKAVTLTNRVIFRWYISNTIARHALTNLSLSETHATAVAPAHRVMHELATFCEQ